MIHLMVLAALAAQDEAKASWTLDIQSVTVDSCGVSCPCLMGEEPHHGTCRFINGFKIKKGNYGDVALDGLPLAVFGEFHGEARKPSFDFVAFYIPKDASPEQKRALRAILASEPFSKLGKPLGVEEADLEVVLPEEKTGTYGLKLGELGSFTIEPLTNAAGKPIVIRNPVYPFPVGEILVGRAKGSFAGHGKDLKLTQGSGEIGSFTLSGPAPAK